MKMIILCVLMALTSIVLVATGDWKTVYKIILYFVNGATLFLAGMSVEIELDIRRTKKMTHHCQEVFRKNMLRNFYEI